MLLLARQCRSLVCPSWLQMLPSQYWLAKPEIVANAGYYYSPHAQKVFAVQAGPISVKWVKAKPSLETIAKRLCITRE